MANKKFNRIALHPIENGIQDPTTDLLSKTSVNSILSGTVDAVDPDGEPTTFDAGYTEDLKYDKVEKEIVIPNYAIDGNEYTLPSTYDFNKLNILDNNITIYEDIENHVVIGTFSDDGFKVIWVDLDEISPFYSNQTNEWSIQESQGAEPVPYTEPITFTYNESCLQNEEYKEILSQILGLEPTIEHITIDRTLKQKNADIKNWEYNRETHTEIIPALTTGTEYKFNFNVDNYIDILNDQLRVLDYGSTDFNDTHINSAACVYNTIHLETYNGDYYTFFFDLLDETVHGHWVNGSGSLYTPEELENITFKYYAAGLQTYSGTLVTSEDIIKIIFNNLDGSAITELVNETTYKFNPNVSEYKDLFIELDRNGSYVYNYSMADSTFKNIQIWTYNYYATPFFFNNGNSYYLIPRIDAAYPGTWGSTSSYWDNSHHVYTPEELEDITFVFDRNKIDGSGSLHVLPIGGRLEDLSTNEVTSESLLHRLLLNLDNTPIADDQEEEVTVITTVDQKMNEPLENKLYGQVEKYIQVSNDFEDDTEYNFNTDMKFTAEEVFNLFSKIEERTDIYVNDNDNEYIWITANNVWEIHYQDNNNNEYSYGVAYVKTGELINRWAANTPTSMYVYLNCINPNYVDILKKVFALGTHTETVYEDKTLKEKVEDLPNWKYSSNVGLYLTPKWDTFAPYIDTWNDIYSELSSKQHVNINFDYDTDYYGEGNCVIGIEIDSAAGHYEYCIYKENYQLFEANTWYDITNESKLPVKLDNPPKLELDAQYAISAYIDLFNAIYGEEIITLKDKFDIIENGILKDKTYDNITKQISIPDDFVDGNYYDFKTNMNFSDSDSEMIDQILNGSSTLIYSEGENSNEIYINFAWARTGGYFLNICYYDASNDTTYTYFVCENNGEETTYYNNWGDKPNNIQIYTDAIVNLDWLNRIVENTTHSGTETVAQTLEEKFAEVEAKINSHTDAGILKDKIYDYTIELENGQEYSLATDMEPFFDRFSSDRYTLIYGSTGGGGGEMPMPMPIYDGNSVASPASIMSNDGNGTRGGDMAIEPALPADPVSPGGLGEIYITRITLVNTYTPPKEKELLAADSGAKGGTELRDVDSVSLGETYVEVCDNFYNYYYYYKGADSWVDDNGDSVTAANLPKFKLDTTLVQNFDMLKFVLQTIPQTLEAKLSEGIANWNYEQGKINSFPNYAPLFNVMSVLQTNSSILGQAGLFNDQDGTRIYQDDTTVIEWSCDNSNYTLNIYYGILDEAESLVYEINCNISMSNNTETWTGSAIPSTGGGGIIVAPATIYSQEELPFIKYYSPANIESGYEQVVPLLLTEIYAKGEPITLAEKLADIKNWEYANIPATYKFKKTVDWSQLPSAGEIDSDIEIYADESRSGYWNKITLIPYDYYASDSGNYVSFSMEHESLEYRNYRTTYTNSQTGSTAEAGKWYLYKRVNDGTHYYACEFIEVTPYPYETINSQYIVNQELFNVIVDSTEAQDYTVADMVEGPLKDKTYDNVLQEKLVDNAEYNLKAELNTNDGNKLIAMSENCVDPIANVGEYDNGMASPWTSFMLDGYLIATGANNSWYYLDETTTWQKIKNIEIINGSSAITDYNKRIASQGTFTYNNKTYLAWPASWPNNTFNQYVIPCTDNSKPMVYEIEFNVNSSTITLTGHKLTFNTTPNDGTTYLYAHKFFEFNNTLLYADSGYSNYLYEIDLENDTATQGIYNKFKCKYGSGTTITNIVEEETLGSFNGRHIITPINGVDFTSWHGADNNGTSTFFKIRHATAAEVAQYPDLNLSETTSVIYDLINPANPTCGISSTVQSTSAVTVRGYVASGRFIYTHNGTNYLGSLYYVYTNYTAKYFAYKFNESTNTWSTVTLNRPTGISDNSFLSGNKFIYDDVSQNTYLVDDYKNIYRVTGLENNQINFEKVELHGTGYPYANPTPEDGEVAQIECSYSADANSYIDTLYIKDDNEIVPIAYCDGSDYWKDIDTDQQIDVSEYTVYNIRKFFDVHVDSSLIELITSLETDVPVTLGEKLLSLVASFNANIPVAAWDTTTDASIAAVYPYQATIQSDYLVDTIKCEVEFSLSDQISGNYAAFYNFDDTAHEVIVYAKVVPADTVSVKITRWLGSKLPDITVSTN